ncbi:disks large-associated protein 5-like [Bombus pascuorum]|uniref:disks large-associated protein 5-like n=1 Tax=Bombus pascuorum TaxID=65598 RepID=UPI0021438E44|nr:disks large-associated protein 5-like [Bombus pascuorum]
MASTDKIRNTSVKETSFSSNNNVSMSEQSNFPFIPIIFSPYVVSSRGKSNARREQQLKRGFSLRHSPSDDDVPTKDTIMKCLNISIEEEERTAQYFHFLLNRETDRLTELCEKWMKIMVEAEITENDQWEISQVIEQTHLLINKKFDRFRKLVTNCETGKGEMLVTCKDLQGFWDMMYMDIQNCDLQFEKLRDLCSQDRKEDVLINKSVTKKKLNSIKATLIKSKQKMTEKIRNIGGKSKLKSNLYQTLGDKYDKNISSGIKHRIKAIFSSSNEKKLSPVKYAKRLSLLQKVQLSETLTKQKPCSKTINLSEICKTPEVQLDDSISYINSNQTPGKSILKQPKNSPKIGCLMKFTNKVNFDDHIVLNEVPIDEETEVKLNLAAALSRIDNLDLDSSNEVTAFSAERNFFFDDVRSDECKNDIKENSKDNKLTSPRTQTTIAFQELNKNLGTPQERSTRKQNFVDKNMIPNQTLPFDRNISTPIKENKDVKTVNTLKQKHTPNYNKKEINNSDESIRILRNRTIISMDTSLPKRRSFSKMSMDIEEREHKENESPLKKKRRTSSFKINVDNNEKMNINESNNNKGRSIKNVKFSGKEYSAERNRPTLSMTSRVQRCKIDSNKYIPIEDSISLEMQTKTPERIRRSKSKIS